MNGKADQIKKGDKLTGDWGKEWKVKPREGDQINERGVELNGDCPKS
jgi:hypothetical protein